MRESAAGKVCLVEYHNIGRRQRRMAIPKAASIYRIRARDLDGKQQIAQPWKFSREHSMRDTERLEPLVDLPHEPGTRREDQHTKIRRRGGHRDRAHGVRLAAAGWCLGDRAPVAGAERSADSGDLLALVVAQHVTGGR